MDDPRRYLTNLFDVAVARADPMRCLAAHLPPRPKGRLVVIGAGKASARMGEALEQVYGPCEGLIITRYGYARDLAGIKVIEAAHPVPDAAGVAATHDLLDLVGPLDANDQVIALISGGGSALLCAPIAGLMLADKITLNAALLASGMPISAMNILRKQVSAVKGGKLAAAIAPAQLLTLTISDVPGDDPSEIASGPTVGSTATAAKALALLDQYNVTLPAHIVAAIAKAPAPISKVAGRTQIIAAPSQSLAAAAQAAGDVDVRMLGDAIEGEARDLGITHAALAMEIAQQNHARPVLLLSGGECTVTRRGSGIGGPNAEYVLAAAHHLQGHPRIHILACDTDGVDGAAEVAGAYAGPTTPRAGMDRALATNDAHGFFAKAGGQIITGPTLTNVNDFRAVLILP